MKDFQKYQDNLNNELEQFIRNLNTLLPRYSLLLKKSELSLDEAQELGDIEHFLIEINSKISSIKRMLEHDIFGHSIDQYYQMKAKAKEGDFSAKLKLETMREAFIKSLKGDSLMNWN